MLAELAGSAALWGFLGAFMYAAPRTVVAIYAARERGLRWSGHVAEGVIALVVGTIAAEAFTAWIQDYLNRSSPHDLRALGVMLGLVSNRAAPTLVDLVAGKLMKRLKGVVGE